VRRIALEFDDARFPRELVVFDGRALAATGTEQEWWAAYGAWCDQRAAWEADHPGVVLPATELGECPVDGELLFSHGGMWRDLAGDGQLRCDAHGRTPGEHPRSCNAFSKPPEGGPVRCHEHGLTPGEH
jgi:hypothetical protein